MSKLFRTTPAAALILCLGAGTLAAQAPVQGDFQWYIGANAGVLVFRTPAQTRGGMFSAGGHTLITAKRTGLLLSIEEGIGSSEQSAYTDNTGTPQTVTFNDIRKYSAVLMAFPIRSAAQPYIGVGVGILHAVNPTPTAGTLATTADIAQAEQDASQLGSVGFGTLVGGLQFKVGRMVAFGQYQLTSSPSSKTLDSGASGRLFTGATHTFSGGLRVSLGSAREAPRTGY
ncbi:MAG TPA: hypothetical protein VFW66_00565 [Gemmatimonadales bacterium]|nr:hypothetical protein [Gemmatimonadales bacterium]